MDLKQSPLPVETPSEPGPSTTIPGEPHPSSAIPSEPGPSTTIPGEPYPSSAIMSMLSGEYDKLERKSEHPPTGILISLSDSKDKLPPESNGSEKTNLNADVVSLDSSDEEISSINNLIPLLSSHGSTNTESECDSLSPLLFTVGSSTVNCSSSTAKSKRSPLLSSSTASESRPLFHSQESSRMESRHLLFGEGSTSESRNVEFRPLLLCQNSSSGRSGELSGECLSALTESRSLSVRRVSFAPDVHTSELSTCTVRGESGEKSFSSKLLSNLNSLKDMMTGGSSSSHTPPREHFPRLFPREYPPPTSPPEPSHPHTSQASQAPPPSHRGATSVWGSDRLELWTIIQNSHHKLCTYGRWH